MDIWKRTAERLYFCEHLKIGEVADKVGKTRQTVSAHLHGCPAWAAEQERRKKDSARRRKIGKLLWDRSKAATEGAIRREHEMAVAELSAEKYH